MRRKPPEGGVISLRFKLPALYSIIIRYGYSTGIYLVSFS